MKLFKRRAKTESGAEPEDRDGLAGEPSPEAAAVPAAPQEESAASPSVAADHLGEALDAKPAETAEPGMFERLRTGLGRSRTQLSEGLASLVLGKKQLDPALMEALE